MFRPEALCYWTHCSLWPTVRENSSTAARRGLQPTRVFLHFSTFDRRENRFPLPVPQWRLGYSQGNTQGFKVDAFTQYLDIFSPHSKQNAVKNEEKLQLAKI